MDTKITNVTPVANSFLVEGTWIGTFIQFIMDQAEKLKVYIKTDSNHAPNRNKFGGKNTYFIIIWITFIHATLACIHSSINIINNRFHTNGSNSRWFIQSLQNLIWLIWSENNLIIGKQNRFQKEVNNNNNNFFYKLTWQKNIDHQSHKLKVLTTMVYKSHLVSFGPITY